MPFTLYLDADDVLGLRFSRSPVWETLHALRTAREPGRQGYHLPWLRTVDLGRVQQAADVLAPVVPRRGVQPDFLSPAPAGPTTTIDDELAAMVRTPPALVAAELGTCLDHVLTRATPDPAWAATLRGLAADPEAAVERLAGAVRTCWDVLVAPFWPEIDDLLAADVAHRADQVARAGLASVLDGLHAGATFRAGVLTVRGGRQSRVREVRGRGLVLMPSVFTGPDVVAVTDPPWRPTLVYPARGAGTLWPPGPRRDPGALRGLVGVSRAALLRALDDEPSTSTLARRVGLGLPTTSEHLRVLRDCGLVTARRRGREVRHRRTALGSALLGSALPGEG